MKCVRSFCTMIFLLAGFFYFGLSAAYADIHDFDNVTPEEILSIAEAKKEIYFGYLGSSYLATYPDEAAVPGVLELAYPFRIHSMDVPSLFRYKTGDNFASLLVPTHEWIVPLSRNGKSRFCISVGYMDGEWQIVGIGMGDFGEYLKKIPPEFMPGKNGTKFVRLAYMAPDFIAVPDGTDVKLIPIPLDDFSAYVDKVFPSDKKDDKGLYSVADVMPGLRESVRGSIWIYPLIRVNGMGYGGVYSADSHEEIRITLDFADMVNSGSNADWWVVLEQDGQLSYLAPSMKWVTDQVPVAQKPLQSFAGYVLYSGMLPVGTYKLYFGVDLTPDGVANEILLWDTATIIVK